MLNIKTLYGKGAHGIKIWKIWYEDNTIHIEANGGRYTEIIEKGLAGRSLQAQIDLRIEARVRGKLDSGFKRTKEELAGKITNQLGLAMPMLATPFKNVKNLDLSKCVSQPKLDGHRCLINSDGAYSRRGKVIDTIPEILEALNVPDGVTLDGELYCHGVSLQTISSWAKRRQPSTLELKYYVYDVIMDDTSFLNRMQVLKELIPHNIFDKVRLVNSAYLNSDDTLFDICRDYNNEGYEGAIIRPLNGLYEIGKRSKSLIKVKPNHFGELKNEDEFYCVDVIPSREGLGILILEAKNGLTFKTIAPGNNVTKRNTLEYKEKYVGSYVTCEYSELTDIGKPFHCVALRWREDL